MKNTRSRKNASNLENVHQEPVQLFFPMEGKARRPAKRRPGVKSLLGAVIMAVLLISIHLLREGIKNNNFNLTLGNGNQTEQNSGEAKSDSTHPPVSVSAASTETTNTDSEQRQIKDLEQKHAEEILSWATIPLEISGNLRWAGKTFLLVADNFASDGKGENEPCRLEDIEFGKVVITVGLLKASGFPADAFYGDFEQVKLHGGTIASYRRVGKAMISIADRLQNRADSSAGSNRDDVQLAGLR